MTTFRKGDIVRAKQGSGFLGYYQEFFEVIDIDRDAFFSGNEGLIVDDSGWWSSTNFELVSPTEQAMYILKKEGYTITPPKVKEKRVLCWLASRSSRIGSSLIFKDKDAAYEWADKFKNYSRIIAMAEVEEGDGLNEAPD